MSVEPTGELGPQQKRWDGSVNSLCPGDIVETWDAKGVGRRFTVQGPHDTPPWVMYEHSQRRAGPQERTDWQNWGYGLLLGSTWQCINERQNGTEIKIKVPDDLDVKIAIGKCAVFAVITDVRGSLGDLTSDDVHLTLFMSARLINLWETNAGQNLPQEPDDRPRYLR